MTTDEKNLCLFFDARGNGPSEIRLIPREVREERDGDQVVVPRAFGLCWEVSRSLHFVENGGFVLTDDVATWLRDELTAWLDKPRLDARKSPTVVASDDESDIHLVRTQYEWGLTWGNDYDPDDPWYATESEAREAFRIETGTVSCESCERFIGRDAADVDEDGIYTCADETACSAACAAKEQSK